MPFWLPAITSRVSAGADYLGQSSKKKQEESELERRRKELKAMLKSEGEIEASGLEARQGFNAAAVETANRFAGSTAGSYNTTSAMAGAVSPIVAQGFNASNQVKNQMKDKNDRINGMIADMPSASGIDIGQTLATGLAGFTAGMEMDSSFEEDELDILRKEKEALNKKNQEALGLGTDPLKKKFAMPEWMNFLTSLPR